MKQLSAILVMGFVAVAAPTSASAGGYIGLGVGANAKLHGDFSDHFTTTDTTAARITIGKRTGPLAIEGSFFGTQLNSVTARIAGAETSVVSAQVGLKYHFTLQSRLEAYIGGGLNKTWISDEDSDFMDEGFSGNGYSASVGLQYNLEAVLTRASIWLDYTHAQSTLTHASRAELDGGTRTLSIGLNLGF